MRIVAYRITLLEPVIVTALAGDPNSAVSYDYLPGSVLRGVFIGLDKRQAKWKDDTLFDPTVRRRFFEASTRFLNGYLVINNVRSLPAPQTWQKNKYPSSEAETSEIKDLAFAKELTEKATQPKPKESDTPQEKTKSLAGNFIVYAYDPASTTQKVYVAKPPHVINVHTERGRERGRSTKGDGAIYRYDALEAGQTFEAQILCNDDSDAEYFFELIQNNPASVVGGARSAGYGRVKFHEPTITKTEREVGGEIPAASDALVLTLLSDTILRDNHGQYSPDTTTLKEALATRLKLDAQKLSFKEVFKNESVVGGFNRKWGLPLPQVQALALGSVFVLDLSKLLAAEKAQLPDKLKSLEWLGLGERRMDGFGRVAVGWQQPQKLEEKEPESQILEKADQTNESLAEEVNLLRKRLEKRLGQQQTDREQLEAANKLKLSKLPPASQLNRLRQQITAALLQPESDTTSVIRFLQNIEGKRADKHFERARVGNLEMRQWLRNQAARPDKYAALRLIDGMLANAAKQSRQEQDQQRGSGNE